MPAYKCVLIINLDRHTHTDNRHVTQDYSVINFLRPDQTSFFLFT